VTIGARKDRILVASRLIERKGVQTLLSALVGLETNFEIVVAGDGPCLTKLKRQADASIPTVIFLGFLSRDELSKQYASSRIFVFPSTLENFPMVLLEAMAHGCAIVTTSAPGCAEIVGDAAILVPPGDVGALREALARLTRDPALADRLARRAAERVHCFAADRIAGQFTDLFRDLLTARARPRAPLVKRVTLDQAEKL
jgi:glycosyltransferase involved in cell wall biosynthesis